jgi:hypothetical protein
MVPARNLDIAERRGAAAGDTAACPCRPFVTASKPRDVPIVASLARSATRVSIAFVGEAPASTVPINLRAAVHGERVGIAGELQCSRGDAPIAGDNEHVGTVAQVALRDQFATGGHGDRVDVADAKQKTQRHRPAPTPCPVPGASCRLPLFM